MKWFIGIDGGGTKTVGWAVEQSGRIVAKSIQGPGNYHTIGLVQFQNTVSQLIDDLAQLSGLDKADLLVVCLGLAGADRPADQEVLQQTLQELGLNCNFIIESDAKIALAAGLGQTEGIVLIAGTGSVAYGITQGGEVIRSGGWGHLASDEGSGYDIGHQALVRCLKSVDSREQKTVLLAKVLEHWHLADFDELIGFINEKNLAKATIGSLAPVVAEAAQSGDAVALAILREAGHALAELVQSVIKRGFIGVKPVSVCCYGGVLQNLEVVRQTAAEALAGQAMLVFSQEEPVAGAVFLARQYLANQAKSDQEKGQK